MEDKCRQAIDEINAVLEKHKVGFEIYVDKDGEIMADIWGADHNQGIGLTLDSISLLEEFKGLITLMR